jgi:di/tricarboxylate transporter
MSDQTITLLILGISVVIFVWNRLPVGIVALVVALSLWATDILTVDQMVEGFGSPTVILIAALFVVAEALDAAGITTWASQQLITHAGDSRTRLLVLVMVTVAVLSALITPNGSVAALYPMVVVLAVRLGHTPSLLLMPLAFAAHAGALLVLTGSPVSLLVSDAAADAGEGRIAYFEVALVGVPLLVGTIAIAVLFGPALLPKRNATTFSRDLSRLPQDLLEQYMPRETLARILVPADSPLVGMIASKIDIPPTVDAHIISLQDQKARPLPDNIVRPGKVLVVRGSDEGIAQFAAMFGLMIVPESATNPIVAGLVNRNFGVAEVIVSPRSAYTGEQVYPGMVTDSGSLVVLAVQRHGEDLGTGKTVLRAGDSLLLQGNWNALEQHTKDPNVVLVDTPDAIRRQTVPLGPKAIPALVVLAAMVILLATGLMPAVVVTLGAAIAMVLLNVVTVDQAHRSMAWTTLILVGAMIPLSTAITETGAAQTLAEGFVDLIGGAGSYPLLIGLFLITAVLGQMISNTATALIIIPVAVSVAVETGDSPMALLMCVNVAAAASLLTPIATPANLMVMDPAGYRFNDYWRLGLPVMLVYLVVAVVLVPLVWPL